MAVKPGGTYASRALHFIWLLDCSGSMTVGGEDSSPEQRDPRGHPGYETSGE